MRTGLVDDNLQESNDNVQEFKCCLAITYSGLITVNSVMHCGQNFVLIPMEFSALQ